MVGMVCICFIHTFCTPSRVPSAQLHRQCPIPGLHSYMPACIAHPPPSTSMAFSSSLANVYRHDIPPINELLGFCLSDPGTPGSVMYVCLFLTMLGGKLCCELMACRGSHEVQEGSASEGARNPAGRSFAFHLNDPLLLFFFVIHISFQISVFF